MVLTAFLPSDLKGFPHSLPGEGAQFAREPDSFTFRDEKTREPIVCAGVIQWWPGRYEGWMRAKRPLTLGETRFVWRAIQKQVRHYRRFEAVVREDNLKAIRWVESLGLELEGKLKSYSPGGADMLMYAKVRGI